MLQNFYPQLLAVHSFLRWFVLIAAVAAILVALAGWSGKRPADGSLRRYSLIFVSLIDFEFLLGLLIYFAASPITRAALQNFGAAMQQHESRFFAVEHVTFMLLAVICAHVGAVLSRKGANEARKHRGAAIAYIISFLLILGGIPWFRPLFRF